MNESPEDILDRGGLTELPPSDINDEVPGPDDDYGFAAPPPREASPSRFVLTRFADFTLLQGDDYCVKGFLPRRGLAVFWGLPKCGKSFIVFDLLMHVALGWDYRRCHVKQGSIVYVCLEGGRGFRRRCEAFRRAKLKGDEDPPFFFIVNPLSLAADRNALIQDIRRQLDHIFPAVVCIDTLNRSLEGSESSDKDMAAYIKAADAIRDAFDCLVVIVHHCGHDGERPRGHSSLMGALDVQIAVRKDGDGNVVAELELAKDGETGLAFISRLEQIRVGLDEDGDPVMSCVVKEVTGLAASARKPTKGRRSEDAERVKRAITEAYERLSDSVEMMPGFDAAPVRKVKVDTLREAVKSRGFLELSESGALTPNARTIFHRAKTDLITSKRYIEADGMFWKLDVDPAGF